MDLAPFFDGRQTPLLLAPERGGRRPPSHEVAGAQEMNVAVATRQACEASQTLMPEI
jgi:hypothetical protein